MKVSTELKIILVGAGIAFLGSFINRILNYVLRIVVARGLGVEAYGLFILAVIIMRTFVAFSSLGLYEGIVRFVPYYRGLKDKERIKGVLSFSFIVTFFSSLIISTFLFFMSDFIAIKFFNSSELAPLLKIFIWMIPIGVLSSNYIYLNLAYEKIKYNLFIADISGQGLRVLAVGLAILFGFGIIGVGYAYLFSYLAILILFFFVSELKVYPLFRSKIKSRFEIKELLSYSWPLLFFGLLGSIMGWTDSFMIVNLLDLKSVGIYNAALPIANLLTMVPLIFVPLFLPLITKNYATKNMPIVDSLTKNVGKWNFLINFPILILMLLFPGFFINLLFGKEYLAATTALRFLSVGFFIFSLSYPSMQLLKMIKKTKLYLINLFIVIPLNVILNYLFISKFGITGAALATAITYFIYSGLFIGESYHLLKLIPISFKFWKPISAGLIALLLVLFINTFINMSQFLTAILLGAILLITYFFLLLILKSFDETDKLLFNHMREKVFKGK